MYLSDRKNFIYYGGFESTRWKRSTVHLESKRAWEQEETAWAPPSSPDVFPHRWTTAPQNPPNQHHKSCHSYSSKGRCQCFNECLINSPFFLCRWCHSRWVAQVGWSVRLLEGVCSSLGTIIQRENINFSLFHALISKLLLLTEWSHLYYAGVAAIFWCLSQYCHFSLLKPTPTLQHWNCLM